MSEKDIERYLKEESFGPIEAGFYDFQIETEFEDVRIVAWPEKCSIANPVVEFNKALRDVLMDSRRIERDLSRYLEITFADVYAMDTRVEGWENWAWGPSEKPKLLSGKLAERYFPILRIEDSAWRDVIFPEWNRDWMNMTTHWRLISLTNCIDILARSATGEWRKGN